MTALDCWFNRVPRSVPAGAALLEFGCGRTFHITRLIGDRFAARFATDMENIEPGDVPQDVVFRRCATGAIPYDDQQFDLIAIRSVIEHVDDPDQTFRELARVTKPGGRVMMNLPNKWDYVSVVARLSGSLKSSILKKIVRNQFDDFPVRYRCNTRRALYKCAGKAGFEVDQFLPLPCTPSYLSFFVPFYLAGAVYQFMVSVFWLDALQPSFMVLLRKPGSGAIDKRASADL